MKIISQYKENHDYQTEICRACVIRAYARCVILAWLNAAFLSLRDANHIPKPAVFLLASTTVIPDHVSNGFSGFSNYLILSNSLLQQCRLPKTQRMRYVDHHISYDQPQ